MMKLPNTHFKRKHLLTYFLTGFLAILSITYIYHQPAHQGPILPCLFQKITGFQCPGCGMTRSIHSLLHFQWKKAFYYNKLIFTVMPLLFLFPFLKESKRKNILEMLSLVLTLSYGIIRNLI